MLPARSRLMLIVAAIVAAVLTAPSLSAHDEYRFIGVVTKMDAAKNLVSVRYKEFDGKEDVVDVTIVARTRITRDNKTVPKTELRAGVNVVIDALGCDAENQYDAVTIRLVPPPKQ